MPDDCTPPKGGWTVDTLFQHFHKVIAEHEKRYEQQFSAIEKATQIAEHGAERWRMQANEWRQAMIDRELNFLPRSLGYIAGALSVIALILSVAEKFK